MKPLKTKIIYPDKKNKYLEKWIKYINRQTKKK